jgi:transglutaminase-like putative cysteine protease
VLLTLAATFGLARLFTRPLHFFAPVALVALAVHVTAWSCRRRNVTIAGSIMVCASVAVVTTSWVALGRTTAYGIPWRGTYHALGPALQAAADAFRSTAVPTAVIPGFVVAGALGAACAAFMGDWAAFRMRATTEAVLPSFSLFVLSAALAQGHAVVTAGAAWLGALLVLLLVRQSAVESPATTWFASRSRRGPGSVLALGGVMVVAAVVLAVAIGPHLPGATVHPVVSWRHSGGNRGNDAGNISSPLVDITSRLKSPQQTEVFTVRTAQPEYLRLTALSRFNGKTWSADDTYQSLGGVIPEADTGLAALPADTDTTETAIAMVHVSALHSPWLPAAYRPYRVSGAAGLRYAAASGSIETDRATSDGLTYTVVSHSPTAKPAQLAASGWVDHHRADLQKYLDLPPSVPQAVRLLAQEHTRAAQGPYQAARMLEEWLRNPPFQYSLDVPADESASALVDFLTKTQAGFCQQFSAAFAVLAREIGLPSRVAVGFTPGVDRQGVYHVTNTDAHAWPEVWFSGIGWELFEPTPGRGSADPNAEAVTGVSPSASESGVTPTTAPGATTTAPRSPTTAPSVQAPTSPTAATGTTHHSSWRTAVALAFASLAAALAWAVALAGIAWAVAARRRRHARSPAARVTLAWSLARESIASMGVPAHEWDTPTEFADRVRRTSLPQPPIAAVARLAELQGRASYSREGATEGDVEAAEAASAVVRQAASVGQRSWKRVRLAADPRPVIAALRAERAEAHVARGSLEAPALQRTSQASLR